MPDYIANAMEYILFHDISNSTVSRKCRKRPSGEYARLVCSWEQKDKLFSKVEIFSLLRKLN